MTRGGDLRAAVAVGPVARTGLVAAGTAICAVVAVAHPVSAHAAGAAAGFGMATVLCALLAEAILIACFRYGHRRRDLVLAAAVASAALLDLAIYAAPALAETERPVAAFGTRLAIEAVTAVAFAAAALPDAKMQDSIGAPLLGLGVLAVGLLAAGAGCLDALTSARPLLGTMSPVRMDAAAGGPVSEAVMIGSAAALAFAGWRFGLGREPDGRPTIGGTPLAAASFLLAAAVLAFVADPALAPTTISAVSGLWLIACCLLVAVALRRYQSARRDVGLSALRGERQRIARDLHDGLSQDLAAITVYAKLLETTIGPDHPLTTAARQALTTSRTLIAQLSDSRPRFLEATLREVAEDLSTQLGIHALVRVERNAAAGPGPELTPSQTAELVRGARTAIITAARAGAQTVQVTLELDGRLPRLSVSNDVKETPCQASAGS